jgi:hypothetical protein
MTFTDSLNEERLRLFGMFRQIARADRKFLKAMGYGDNSNAEALLSFFTRVDAKS